MHASIGEVSAATLAQGLAGGAVVLDGGLATELEASGHDLSDALWSARLLRDDPAAVVAAHLAFYRAGAQVATTASYQASFEGFAAAGMDAAEADRLLRRSVALAREARDERAAETDRPLWVAASVGPYGAMLADGSEYRGDYDLDVRALRRFHRRRLTVLADAGADVLALETIPCLAEAEALVTEAEDLGVPFWLSLTCSATRTRRGEPAAEGFQLAGAAHCVVAVGVNCTDPRDAVDLVPLAAQASGRAVVVYPNSGERWDAGNRRWVGQSGFAAGQVGAWLDGGARLVGGCCRVRPDDIAWVRAVVDASTGDGPSAR